MQDSDIKDCIVTSRVSLAILENNALVMQNIALRIEILELSWNALIIQQLTTAKKKGRFTYLLTASALPRVNSCLRHWFGILFSSQKNLVTLCQVGYTDHTGIDRD